MITLFKRKDLAKTETLGEKLRRIRQENNYTLKDVEAETKVSAEYLEFLENSEYKRLPSRYYIRQYIKKYADFLGLNWLLVSKILEREILLWRPQKSILAKPHFSKKSLVIPRVAMYFLLFLLIFALGLYLIFEVFGFSRPPELQIDLPDMAQTSESSIKITGKTEKEANVFINGQLVSIDKNGNFEEVVALQNGLNSIKIGVKKKFSKEREITKQVLRIN